MSAAAPGVDERWYGELQRVTLLTPTREGRAEQLAECVASVAAQTEPVRHLSLLDYRGEGPAATRNRLLQLVETPYVGFVDDDDLLDADHVASLMSVMHASAGVAWSRCRLLFAPGVAHIRVPVPLRINYEAMCKSGRNFIPVTVIARTNVIVAAGGFDAEALYEDYDLWCRLIKEGAVFVYLNRVTWTYRFLGENRTHA